MRVYFARGADTSGDYAIVFPILCVSQRNIYSALP
jgi:hypothetical protein